MKKRGRRIWGFVLLFLLVAVFLLWNLHAGSVSISAAEIRQILLGRSQDSTKWNIIRSIRLPRLLSALILGGLFALLAFVIYLLAIRDAVDHIRSQAETVYEVARAAQTGYEWLTEKVTLFLRLREEFRSK